MLCITINTIIRILGSEDIQIRFIFQFKVCTFFILKPIYIFSIETYLLSKALTLSLTCSDSTFLSFLEFYLPLNLLALNLWLSLQTFVLQMIVFDFPVLILIYF